MYNPDGLIRQAKANGQPIIFVAINYRLGRIRENIAVFGGDPENVTAIGQSVGASSIALHLTSYRGRKGVPFQKAVLARLWPPPFPSHRTNQSISLMSGASGLNFNIMSSHVANNTAKVAASLGCIHTHGSPDSEETLQCLKNTPMETLNNVAVSHAREAKPPFGELYFYPSWDGDYIPERPSVSLRKGDFVKGSLFPSPLPCPQSSLTHLLYLLTTLQPDLPLISSFTTNDGAWYAPPNLPTPASALATLQRHILSLSPSSLSRLLELYPLSSFPDTEHATQSYHLAARLNRDFWFACPVLDFGYHYSRHSKPSPSANGSKNVYLYALNSTRYTPIYRAMGVPHWGVAHLSDIPYLMATPFIPGGDNSETQQALSRKMAGAVAAFAYSGDPNTGMGFGEGRWEGMLEGVEEEGGGLEGVEAEGVGLEGVGEKEGILEGVQDEGGGGFNIFVVDEEGGEGVR
ncbi:MAG: hypothetical protein LQ338_008012, partial [Usnochroma carphineum]